MARIEGDNKYFIPNSTGSSQIFLLAAIISSNKTQGDQGKTTILKAIKESECLQLNNINC
jgi:hypothetical protein